MFHPEELRQGAIRSVTAAICWICAAVAAQPSLVVNDEPGSAPLTLVQAGGEIFFSADDGLSGRELWRLSPDGSYRMVSDIVPGPEGSDPGFLTALGAEVFFFAGEIDARGGLSRQLYKTDGTRDGTHRVSDLDGGLDVRQMIALDWAILVSARTNTHGLELWAARRDVNTRSGWGPLQLVRDVDERAGDGISYGPLNVHDGAAIFAALHIAPEGRKSVVNVWREQDPLPTPLLAADGRPIPCSGSMEAVSTGEHLYVAARGDEFDLWIGNQDLTEVRPVLAADPSIPQPSEMTAVGNTLYFMYQRADVGRELFALEAESGDVRLVADINPGPTSSTPYRITPLHDGLVFNATRDDVGTELWSIVPDAPGPVLLGDFVPGPEGSRPYAHRMFGDHVYFSCDHPEFGEELWSTDGTPDGTRLVRDINPGIPDAEPYSLTVANDSLYFTARSLDSGEEVWRLPTGDETPEMATEIRPVLLSVRSTNITELVADHTVAYFVTTTPDLGTEIWRSDGTESGTRVLFDLVPGPASSNPSSLRFLPIPGTVEFDALDTNGNRQRWEYQIVDDSLAIAAARDDLNTRTDLDLWNRMDAYGLDDDQARSDAVKVGNVSVYAAWSQSLGRELWMLPDREHTPSLLADVFPGPASGNPSALVSTGRFVVFRATGMDNPATVWVSDGTPAGTRSVGVGVPHDATMWDHGVAMIVRTADGRRRLMTYSPETGILMPHLTEWQERAMNVRMLRGNGTKLFFVASHPSFGDELWSSDRPGWEGTRMICDLTPNHVAKPSLTDNF